MKQIINVILIMIISFSCKTKSTEQETNGQESDSLFTNSITIPDSITIEKPQYLENAVNFSKHILDKNLKRIDYLNPYDTPRHIKIFEENGLERIICFYNKNYSQNVKPNYYEHFLLFCLEYSNSNYSKLAFDTLCYLNNVEANLFDTTKNEVTEKARHIHFQAKPGGLIFQKSNWIFSLVETCRNVPNRTSWHDYEQLFISYINSGSSDSLTVLNADCGDFEYKKETRK